MNTNNNIPDFDLNNFKKENPFKVPANYFDDLPQTIQNKITDLPKSESIFDKLMIIFSPKFGIAFAGVLILALFAINYFEAKQQPEVDYLANVNIDTETSIEEIDSDSYRNDEDRAILADLYQPEKTTITLTDEVLIDFLIEEGYDEYDLYN